MHVWNRWSLPLWGVANVVLSLLVYAPALHGGFIWDDVDIYIVHNDLLSRGDGLYRFWFTTEPLDYYPLAYTTFWLEWRLWGFDTFGYHIDNVLIHALGATLLVWSLRQLGAPAPGLVGLLFALHPVCVESTAWIAQRKTLLGSVLAFGAFGCYLKRDGAGGIGWLAAAWFLFAASLAGKPVAVALPLILLGHAWWKTGRIDRQAILRFLPFFALSILFGVVGVWFQQVNAIGKITVREQDWLARCLTAARAIWFYALKDVLPLNLMFVYPRWTVVPTAWSAYLPAAGLLALAVLFWRRRQGWGRHAMAALGWFVLMVLPGSGLVDVFYWRYTYVGDHYQYPALPAVLAGLASAAAVALKRTPAAGPLIGRVSAALALVALGALTTLLARDYRSAEILWEATLQRNPDAWLAHTNLGRILLDQGKGAAAGRHYEIALRLRPELAESHNNRGVLLARLGRSTEAVADFQQAVRLNADDSLMRLNLGVELAKVGRSEEALAAFQTAQELFDRQPRRGAANLRASTERGLLLSKLGRYDEALATFSKNLALAPTDTMTLDVRGRTYVMMKRYDEAIASFRAALDVDPRNLEAKYQLGRAFCQIGKEMQAVRAFEEAAPLPAAKAALVWVLAASLDDSVRRPEKALAWAELLKPAGAEAGSAWDAYSVALAANGRYTEASAANAQALAAYRDDAFLSPPEKENIIVHLESRRALFAQGRPFRGGLFDR